MANAGTLQIMVVADTAALAASMTAGVKSIGQLEASAKRLATQLLDEERVLRMGADAAYDYKLALAGVSKEQRDALRSQRESVNALRAEAEARRDLEDRQFAEFLKEEKAAKEASRVAQEELNATMVKGRAVADSVLTPVERYQKEVADLTKLLKQGAISQDVFNRAVAGAKGKMAAASAVEPWMDRLKKQFGARGPLKDLVELAVGGGAIAGISFLTSTIERATENAKTLSMEFRAGTKTTGEMVDESLKLIPIFGDIYAAGRNIREVITGEEAALARVRMQAELVAESYEKVRDIIRQIDDAQKDLAKGTKQIIDQTALDQAKQSADPTKAIRLQTKQEREALVAELGEARKALIQKVEASLLGPERNTNKEIQRLSRLRADIDETNASLREMATTLEQSGDVAGATDLLKQIRSTTDISSQIASLESLAASYQNTRDQVKGFDDETKKRLDAFDRNAQQQLRDALRGIEVKRMQAENAIIKSDGFAGLGKVLSMRVMDGLKSPLIPDTIRNGIGNALIVGGGKLSTTADAVAKSIKVVTDSLEDLDDFAKSIRETTKTPMEKFKEQMERIRQAFKADLIDRKTRDRAELAARPDLENAVRLPDFRVQFADFSQGGIGTGATDTMAAQIASAIGVNLKSDAEQKQLIELQKQVRELQELNRKVKVGSSN
jgi:hypothetical protein